MFYRHPTLGTTAATQGKRKLVSALLAGALMWLPASPAQAVITDTVTATGTMGSISLSSTATANVDVVDADPKMTIVKSGILNDGSDGSADPGDTITYTFTVTNTGNVTLNDIYLDDPGSVFSTAHVATLAPGAVDTLSFNATHTLTAPEIVSGNFTNTATFHAKPASGGDITAVGIENTPVAVLASMLLEKSGVLNLGLNGRADVNDTITYSFKVTNTGPTPLHNVKVSDPLVNLASLPGQDRMVAMLNAEQEPSDPITTASIASTPTFAAADQFGAGLGASNDVPPVAADIAAVRKIVRMSGTTDAVAAGDKIGFVYALNNTGEGPLTTITVHQPGAEAYGNSLDLLAPNTSDSANIIFTRAVTAQEVAAGEIIAPARITGKSRNRYLTRDLADHLLLSGIAEFDTFATASITPSTVVILAAGATTTFTAIYNLTQANIDAGFVDNTATASGLNTADQILTSVSSFHQPLVAVPGVAMIKTGSVNLGADNVASVGDVVSYQFAITNTGNVTLTGFTITDANASVGGTLTTPLAPGATNSTAFTATHALTQIEIDAGQVSNQATVEATAPDGTKISKLSDDDKLTEANPTIVSLAPAPKIALLKTVFAVTDVNTDGMIGKDDTITYHFAVTNTGNQTLTNITVTDPLVAVSPAAPLATLAPGQTDTTYFSSVYFITQADVDNGEVDNTAKAEGFSPNNSKVEDYSDPGVLTGTAPTKTLIPARPLIGLIKTEDKINFVDGISDTNNNSIVDAGDIIHYIFTVENSGNVTLTNINIVDHLAGATVQGAPLASLAPQTFDATHFKATYTITQSDVQAGRVSNQATASGMSPKNGLVSDLSDNAATNKNNPTITPITPLPAIALIKNITAIIDSNSNGVTDQNDTITYSFDIQNTGNMPLNTVSVADAPLSVAGPTIANLPAGNTVLNAFTATYVLTNVDITAGQFSNQARVQGTTATNTTVFDDSDNNSFTEDDPTIAYFAKVPSIALIKSVINTTDSNSNLKLDTGDVIIYKLEVINNGNVGLTNITVTDPNASVTGGPILSLAPNAVNTTTFSATHVVTAAEFLAGQVINQATVHAFVGSTTTPLSRVSDDNSVNGSDPTVTPLSSVPGIALIKTVKLIDDVNRNGITDPNDIITYAFDVVNIGNVDLSNIALTDTNATLAPISGTLASLPRGTHNNSAFTATHIVTIPEAIEGFVSNSADIVATTPTAETVRDTSDKASITGDAPTVTPVTAPPAVLTKTANKTEVRRGETVTYTITASNLLGSSYNITDIMPPSFNFVAGSATVNGVAVAAVPSDRDINFTGLAPVSGSITIKLKLLASTTLAGGKFTNNAVLINARTGLVVGKAQATVTIAIEAVFDCSDVIGRVFDDQNANGYMDNGEPGLPGVRVVTLNGVLITTDSEGRYHVPCAAVPDSKIGSNYLLKLDVRTLPTGYTLTTENPRDVRVTKGKVVKLNFGATIAHEVRLDLNAKAFDEGTSNLKAKWVAGVDKLVEVLKKKHATLKIVYRTANDDNALAAQRLSAVQDTIIFAWENSDPTFDLNVTTSVENGK